jgi:hypothetical protein
MAMLCLCASHACFAQYPGMWIYFNEGLSKGVEESCPDQPPGSVLDSLYIVAKSFPVPISQIEYRVNYPPQILWLGDWIQSGTAEGNTPTGIIQSWESPQDASTQLVLVKVLFIWMCQLCYDGTHIRICVDANPNTGFLRALTWPGPTVTYPDSWEAFICPNISDTYPIRCFIISGIHDEQTTWGSIKMLYK